MTVTGLDLNRIQSYLDSVRPEFLELLESIVNVDSGTYDKLGVDTVSESLRSRYVAMGADIEVITNEQLGDTFVARFRGDGPGSLLLLGHTDTVYPLGTVRSRPFTIAGTRATGPGVSDMKAGDLAILFAVQALLHEDFRDFKQITIVHNSDEEIGSPSSRDLIRAESERADAVFVTEAGRENGNIVSARKGIATFDLTVSGRSAHAGANHHLGRSAALELAHMVVALESINGTVPGATLNVGRIEAGERANVVPHWGKAHLEGRAFEIEHLNDLVARVEDVVQRERVVEDTDAQIVTHIEHYPMHKSAATAKLVELAQSLAEQLGFSVKDMATGGASDGNTAASAGRPVLDGLGPVGGLAHSPDEWLDINSIVPRTALLAGLVATVGSRGMAF